MTLLDYAASGFLRALLLMHAIIWGVGALLLLGRGLVWLLAGV
jgi:hypothetical protein